MINDGIIHAELSRLLASLRHTDSLVISDSGLPVGPGVAVVDLAVVYGLPAFLDVLDPILAEITVEASCASTEVVAANPDIYTRLSSLPALELLPHEQFKEKVAGARFVVRTGEASPYANVLLTAGVPWLRERPTRPAPASRDTYDRRSRG